MRRAAHNALTKATVQRYHPTLTKEAIILVSALLANPDNRENHFLRAGASTIMSILYDYSTLKSVDDKAVKDIANFVHLGARAASVGTFLVEFFPWIMHIPQRHRLSPLFQDSLHI
jgi:hypothetical protein